MSSVVIIGGNERLVHQYIKVCELHGLEAKVFVNCGGSLRKKMGRPDIIILFINTVSHKMVNYAVETAKRHNIRLIRVRPSSAPAMERALCEQGL